MPLTQYACPMNRRLCLHIIFLGTVFSGPTLSRAAEQALPDHGGSSSSLGLWYREPALHWVEALPVGNGRLGAMVFGGVQEERLQLNDGTLWAGGPYNPVNPEA